ncbi:MAG: adenine deaminase C-terminal domain-containing protein, partial [Coprococcus sp.]
VKRSIELGLDPVQAIQMATINAAKHFRLEDKIGSVAPGRFADILLIDDLTTMKPKLVLKSGRIVADENGARPVPEKAYPEKLFDTVHIGADFSAEKFIIHSEGKRAKCRVIDLIKDQIINKEIFEWMDVKEGQIAADVDRDILKLAVVERYGKNGRVSTALVHGFGLKQGALAASVSHDHHNIVVVGTNDRDMAVCVEKLQELHGGFVSAVEGQVVDALALPLGGLMSTLPAKTVMKRMDEMNGAVEKMGCPMKAPFMSLSFISLPTVPELGLTDFGLIDVLGHQIIDMIVETEA